VLSQAQAGPASARNYGAQMAQGDLLLFTDADCVPAADWVEQHTARGDRILVKGSRSAAMDDVVALLEQRFPITEL